MNNNMFFNTILLMFLIISSTMDGHPLLLSESSPCSDYVPNAPMNMSMDELTQNNTPAPQSQLCPSEITEPCITCCTPFCTTLQFLYRLLPEHGATESDSDSDSEEHSYETDDD